MNSNKKTVFSAAIICAFCAFSACGGVEEEVNEQTDELTMSDDAKSDGFGQVQVRLDKRQYTIKENITAKVTNVSRHKVSYLPGCNATTLEKYANGGWQFVQPEKICVWEGYAGPLAPRSTMTDGYAPKEEGTYRVKVGYKTDCLPQVTFSQCSGATKTVYSAPFKVTARGMFCGGIAGLPCPAGYECVLDGNYPDAGGRCEKKRDCRVTGCHSGSNCQPCKSVNGPVYVCLPSGAMC